MSGRRALGVALTTAIVAAPGALVAAPGAGATTIAGSAPRRGEPVAVYLTTQDGAADMTRQPDLQFAAASARQPVTIAVEPRRRFQLIDGVGAAFTDSSLFLLSELPPATRTAALDRLLEADPASGSAGLTVMRIPIGASDFSASGMYSYDENGGAPDPGLAHFSVARDELYTLPVLRQALEIDPRLRIIASPWSAPAWMKSNDAMVGSVAGGGPAILDPGYYKAFAGYIVRFIQAYEAAGVPIWAVTPQNEPQNATSNYPGMFMTAADEARFVAGFLAPALRAARLPTLIYGYDYVWQDSSPFTTALLAATHSRLAGLAYHCYFGSAQAMSAIHSASPGTALIEDECSVGFAPLSPVQVVIRSLDNWASAALMWNVALDPSGGPKLGTGCTNCTGVVTIDPDTDQVSYGLTFWQLAQVGAFLDRGARRIGASILPAQPACGAQPICGLESTAFVNPDGDTVVVVTNSATAARSFAVAGPGGAAFSYRLAGERRSGLGASPSADVATFVWGPTVG